MPVFELKGTVAYEWTKGKNTLRVTPHYEHTTRDGAFAVAVEKDTPNNARLIALTDGSFEVPLPEENQNVPEENKNIPEGNKNILIQAALSQISVLLNLDIDANGKVNSLAGFQFPAP